MSEKSIAEVVSSVKSVSRLFEAVLDLSKIVDRLGDLEAATLTQLRKLEDAQQGVLAANVELDETRERITVAQAEVTALDTKAQAIMAQAKQFREQEEGSAHERASEIVAKAHNQAALVQEDIGVLNAQLEVLRQTYANEQAQYQQLLQTVADTKAQLRAIAS
jgi:chromosome segregation ATPase